MLLSSIPIDWNSIFVAPDPKAGVPVTGLTLLDLYRDTAALTRFNNLKLGQLQLQNTLLRGARFVSFLFGATKLKWIPPYGQDAWCAAVGKPPACTDFDVTTTTVLGLDVAGLLDDTQIARLGRLTVGRHHRSRAAGDADPELADPEQPDPEQPDPELADPEQPDPELVALADRDRLDRRRRPLQPDRGRRLHEVHLAGGLPDEDARRCVGRRCDEVDRDVRRPGVPEDRLDAISPLARINFNAFSVGLIGLENLPWESWPFDGLPAVRRHRRRRPLPPDRARCPATRRTSCARCCRTASSSRPARARSRSASAPRRPSPIRRRTPTARPGRCLPQATGCVGGGNQTVRLDFQGLAGFRLGEQTSIVRLIVGSTTSAATGQAPVTVTQNNEPDGDPATAPAIQPNTLAIGHIATSGDLDWRSLSTTGMVPGTKIQVFMRPPAGTDLDVFLTKPSSQSLLSSPIPNSPIPNSPIPNSALPDNGNSLNTPTDNPQPEGLQDAPIPNSTIAALGHHPRRRGRGGAGHALPATRTAR